MAVPALEQLQDSLGHCLKSPLAQCRTQVLYTVQVTNTGRGQKLFLSNGNSVVLEKSTVPESVMNTKLKSVPKAALQLGVYVTAALTVPCIPSISVTIMLSIQWVPVHVT